MLVFIFLFVVNSTVFADSRTILLDNVNTKNFKEKLQTIPLSNIKQVCSYDFCDYVNIDEINSGLINFTKKYIATIDDVEIQKIISVKGLKITKIILYD